jgi:hypothetical protein
MIYLDYRDCSIEDGGSMSNEESIGELLSRQWAHAMALAEVHEAAANAITGMTTTLALVAEHRAQLHALRQMLKPVPVSPLMGFTHEPPVNTDGAPTAQTSSCAVTYTGQE